MALKVGLEARDILRPHPGGIGRYALELGKGMHAVLQAAGQNEQLAVVDIEMLYPLRRLMHAKHRPADLPARWYRKRASAEFDIVHAAGGKFPSWRAAMQIATVHDLYDYSDAIPVAEKKPAEVGPPAYIAESDRIICVSETTRQHLHQLFDIPMINTAAIGLGVDEAFKPSSTAVVAEYLQRAGLPKEFFLFVGRLRANKNFARLAAAYALAKPGIPLVIAGNLHKNEQAELSAVVRQFDIQSQVLCTGFVADADLPSLISAAAAVTFPSTFEGFGLPVLEAMACGTPVLTSAGVSTEEVANGYAVLVDPYNVESIAAGLTDVLQLPTSQLQAAMTYAQSCTWQKTAKATLAFYLEHAA